MSREKDLAKNTLIITIGNLCTKLITFFLLPLYTGILSTSEYGTVDLLNTLVSLMLPIITFQIEQAVFRNLLEVRNNESKKKEIISSSFFVVILQCSIYILLFMIISPFIKNQYKIFLATNVIVHIFASLFLQIARGLGENKTYAIGSFISATSTILLNILFLVILKYRVNGMLLGTMLGQLICIVFLFFKLKLIKYISIQSFKKNIIKKLWKYSIPLIPNSISWWIFNSSDRLIVSMILGLSFTGLLSASYKFSGAYILIYNIFNMSWTESISLHIDDFDIEEYYNNMFNIVLKFFTSIAIGLIAFMPFIWPVLINSKFNQGYGLVPILLFASLFNVVVGLISVIYVAKKNTKAIANTSIVSALINIIVHLALIKWTGLYAAAISTLASFLIMSIYRLRDISKKYLKINIDNLFIIKTILISLLIIPSYYVNNKIISLSILLITAIYIFNVNKKTVNVILRIIKKDKRKVVN